MNVTGIGLHAGNGVTLIVELYPSSTAISIVDPSEYDSCAATIFLPEADYERAKRACESFNSIMSESDANPAAAGQ